MAGDAARRGLEAKVARAEVERPLDAGATVDKTYLLGRAGAQLFDDLAWQRGIGVGCHVIEKCGLLPFVCLGCCSRAKRHYSKPVPKLGNCLRDESLESADVGPVTAQRHA